MKLGPEWNQFSENGHQFIRKENEEIWKCANCGATKDTNTFTGLPDDSWAKLRINGKPVTGLQFDLDDEGGCELACLFVIMES